MNTRQNLSSLQRPQHGGALILMVLILILGVAAVMMSSISTLNSRPAVVLDPVTKQGLVAAKEGLITWASMRGIANDEGVPPGLLPYPDRRTGGNYDGNADCPSTAQPTPINPILRFGKLPILGENGPCRSFDGNVPQSNLQLLDARDSSQEVIWYAVSTNLLDDRSNSLSTLSSQLLAPTIGNWLTVCDQKGNVLSNQVAFVVIAPGPVLPGQSRVAAAPTAPNFLDAFPLPSSGTAPCNSATENNFDGNDVFIANNGSSTQFNDQLLYVTKQEFFGRVTEAVAKKIANHLRKYAQSPAASPRNVFPFVAAPNISPSSTGNCDSGIGPLGRLPTNTCDATLGIVFMDDPLESNGWYGSVNYSLADISRQTAQIQFQHCANITYIYKRDPLGNFTFEAVPTNSSLPRSC